MPKDSDTNKLEYKILFAVIVAGKSAKFAESAMNRFRNVLLNIVGPMPDGWFGAIRVLLIAGCLGEALRKSHVGNYAKTSQAFQELANSNLNLKTCSIEDLEKIHGIGRKTSRFFMRWTDRRMRIAVLDTHILQWLAERGHAVPTKTPQSKKLYARIEQMFLQEADRMKIHPADLDSRIWLERNSSGIRT